MGIPAPTELILILLILVVAFGGKKIPEIMGSIGQGIKIFKKSMESEEPHAPPQEAQPPPRSPAEEARTHQQDEPKADPK